MSQSDAGNGHTALQHVLLQNCSPTVVVAAYLLPSLPVEDGSDYWAVSAFPTRGG